MTHPRKLKYTMKGREITERKVQVGELEEREDVLVEPEAMKGKLFQPNRGVNPNREESAQHKHTAAHERLCVAMTLYLRVKTEWQNVRKRIIFFTNK